MPVPTFLPGLVLLVLALAAAWAAGRWYDPVPRRVTALFVVLVGAAFFEVLVAGDVLLPLDNLRGDPPFGSLAPADPHGNLLQGDLVLLVEPARRAVREAWTAGAWPLLAPRLAGGAPLLADPQAQALQPLELLGLAVPPLAAPAAVAAAKVYLALLFSFLLLRRLGAAAGPAAAGAVAYGLSGFALLWVGWPLGSAAPLLAAALYAVVLAEERGLRRDWGLVVASLAALLLAGQPEAIAYAGATVALVAGARLAGRPAGRRLPWAGRLAAAAALAACLAAPALLPFAEYLPETLRWERLGGPTGPVAGGGGGPLPGGLGRVAQTAAPNAFGNSRYVAYWGAENSNEDAAGFAGTATLLLALLALGARSRPLRHERLALALAAACLAAWALPVPASGRLALPLVLALAIAAAATLERIRRGERPRLVPVAAVALGLAAVHAALYVLGRHPEAPETLEVLRWGWLLWHLRFLAAAALLLAAVRLRPVPLRAALAPGMVLLLATELLLAHRAANPPAPAELAFPATGPLAHLEERAAPGERLAATGGALPPNLASLYGLADVRGAGPMAPAALLATLGPAIAGWEGEAPVLAVPGDGRAAPALDRLGVAWLLLPPGGTCPGDATATFADRDGTVCHRPGALPPVRAADGRRRPGESLPAAVSRGGDRWRIVPPAAGARLTTGLYAAPGWRASADGRPLALATAGGALVAVDAPPGTRRLDLVYRPAGFLWGSLAAAVGLAGALAWLAAPLAPPGRRETGPRG